MLLSPSWVKGEPRPCSLQHGGSDERYCGTPCRACGYRRLRISKARLSVELWACVFRHVRDVPTLGRIACVCKQWNREVTERWADDVWRDIWQKEAIGSIGPEWTRRACGGLRGEVAASRLLRSGKVRSLLTLPPSHDMGSCERLGDNSESLSLNRFQVKGSPDLEEVLGDPVCIQVFGRGVCLVGFTSGVGIFEVGSDRTLRFVYDVGDGLIMFGKEPLPDGRVLALTERKHVRLISPCFEGLPSTSRGPDGRTEPHLSYKVVDKFEEAISDVTQLVASRDGTLALVGFADGKLRIVDLNGKKDLRVLSMRESIDLLEAGERIVVAANYLAPMNVTAWDIKRGRALHRFSQTCVGWEEIDNVSGIAVLNQDQHIIVWDGKQTLLIVDSDSGRVLRNISTYFGTFLRGPRGYLGQNMLLVCGDGKTVVVASATHIHTVLVDNTSRAGVICSIKEVVSPRMALSTDSLGLVVAEGGVGPLEKQVSLRSSALSPRLRVLDRVSGASTISVPLRSPVSSLSVAGSTIAVLDKAARYVAVVTF